ncbi:MAG: D-aminoacyl-tRNA deacylase [Planctomycetota bacterium]
MRTVLQRVTRASVTLPGSGGGGGEIGPGLVVLSGFQKQDTPEQLLWIAKKIANLRIFPDDARRMNRSVADVPRGSILIVPNFTVGCEIGKGNRPGFDDAMPPDQAEPMFDEFVRVMRTFSIPVETGVFGAEMHVSLCNDGPVTFILESPPSPASPR